MIECADSFTPAVEAPEPRNSPRTRGPGPTPRSGDRSPGRAPDRTPKSRDAAMTKVSFYLPAALVKKLVVAGVIRGQDQSDVVASVLARELSSVTYSDRSTRPPAEGLTVTEIGMESSV